MKKEVLWIVVIVILALIAGVYVIVGLKKPAPEMISPVKTAAITGEARVALPKVLTLYQKGEGESDLAVFVSQELARGQKKLADFRLINMLDEPQMADYYGVSTPPVIIFLTPAGKLFKKHEGYLDKKEILKTLAAMKKS